MHIYVRPWIPLIVILSLTACRPITTTPTAQQVGPAATSSTTTASISEASSASPPIQTITDTMGSQALDPTESADPDQNVLLYEGRSPYGEEFPQFTVGYNPHVWQLVTGEQENILHHKALPSCKVSLAAGAFGAFATEKVTLGDYSWDVAEVGRDGLHYSIPYETLAYMFDIFLPPDAEESERAECRAAAEQVISTFALLP